MKISRMTYRFITPLFLSAILFMSSAVPAQETPLTLAKVLTALQSESSSMTLLQKNTFITQRVRELGVTFASSQLVVDELKRAGASPTLIAVIRANGPDSNQTSTTTSTNKNIDIKFERLWIEKNIRRNGRMGIVVHTHYTAYNLLDVPLQLTVRIQGADGKNLKSSNVSYKDKVGDLALFKNFKPGHLAAEYKDWNVFIPYDEIPLGPGSHSVKIDADVIYPEGKLLKHLILRTTSIVKPRPSLKQPRALFEKMWVDYGVREGGLLGMRIHVKMKVYNLKDELCYLKIQFERQDGQKLKAGNTLYADRSGGVSLSSELKPGHLTTVYNDVSTFMPYDELNLPKGVYRLKMHADLAYPDGGLIKHLNYYNFRFTQP